MPPSQDVRYLDKISYALASRVGDGRSWLWLGVPRWHKRAYSCLICMFILGASIRRGRLVYVYAHIGGSRHRKKSSLFPSPVSRDVVQCPRRSPSDAATRARGANPHTRTTGFWFMNMLFILRIFHRPVADPLIWTRPKIFDIFLARDGEARHVSQINGATTQAFHRLREGDYPFYLCRVGVGEAVLCGHYV